MSKSPVLGFRDAVLAIVKAVPEVAERCEGRVWDVVPATKALAKLPHVSCGPAQRGRGENGHAAAHDMLRLRIFINSDLPARDEAWALAHAIEGALEGAEPEIGEGYQLIDIVRVVNMGDVIDKLSPTEVYLDVTTTAQAV